MFLKSSKRRYKEKCARAMARSMLADPRMRDRVKKFPRMKREVYARCLYCILSDKVTEATYVFQEAKRLQFKHSGKRPLNAVRFSIIADNAAAMLSALDARAREAAVQGLPSPNARWPKPAASCLLDALAMYAHRRRSPTARGFDSWLWKKCWLYADQRRMYRPIAEDVLSIKRAFPNVRIHWIVAIRIESMVRQSGADREELREVFRDRWS